uniref:Exportin 5 n=1 Tax=Nothobranchius furzeri TaxID=105023 RepID=A0A8C6KSB2_NOTFU
MAEPVAAMCDQLTKAVLMMMDAETSQVDRMEALKFCEDFKESSTLCVPCGLRLADKTHPALVRHFGLQILEHVIKYRWNNMEQQEKVQLKECAMQLLSSGTCSIMEEERHIKDGLSRIIVEMIKREWPQNWPDMLEEMEALTSRGETQTELVMLILLRLAEDVITFQTLPSQRRRDIQQTLTQNMERIFTFLLTILRIQVEEYRIVVSVAKAHCRVAVAVLNTLAGYIDWVSLVHITSGNCKLLEMLCLLLVEPELQLEASECLLIALSRKASINEKLPTLSCTSRAVEMAERRYVFLKRLCQVLCALGFQLCSLVVSLSLFVLHLLKSCTVSTWASLFRHETLSKVAVVREAAIKYLKAAMTNLVKTGFPSRNDSPSCEYSRIDFDNDQDFNFFFSTYRSQQGDIVRCVSRIVPLEGFQMAAEWLLYQIASPINPGDTMCKRTEGLCSILSPSVIQWDAATVLMECVSSQIMKSLEEEKLPIDQSMELLQAVLNYDTRDPLILSCVLSNISALFPFVIHRPQFLPQVLSKLFKAITFELGPESKTTWTRSVKSVRRHACSSVIKICRDYPQFILPCFEMFYNDVKELFSSNTMLTYMEKGSLIESLVLISNQFKNFEKQKAFLDELMASVVAEWTSEEMRRSEFLSFVGADQAVAGNVEDTAGPNRSRLSFCLFAMLAVVKRAHWPSDLEEAKAGGFVRGYTPAGAPIYRNPCAEQFLAFLPNLLALIRYILMIFELMDGEKNVILGLPQHPLDFYDAPVYKSSLERMQRFFFSLYDNCFHVLGAAGPGLQQDFYTVEKLAEGLTDSAFSSLDHVPDHRLRPNARLFVKPLALSCPPEYYESLLRPLLGPLFTYMLQVRQEPCQDIEVTQEMLEEELVRLITREVMDLLSEKIREPNFVTQESSQFLLFQNIYLSLLTLAFTSLSWNDATNCHRTASMVCWTLLRQVVSGNLLAEAVAWFFTCVLRGLHVHGQHEVCNSALSNLAFQIYESLRPRYLELKGVMTQIPNISKEALDQYDKRLLNPSVHKAGEKKRKDQFKKLIAGTVGKALCQQFRKEVHIRNLPSLFKSPKPDVDIVATEPLGLSALFTPEDNAL